MQCRCKLNSRLTIVMQQTYTVRAVYMTCPLQASLTAVLRWPNINCTFQKFLKRVWGQIKRVLIYVINVCTHKILNKHTTLSLFISLLFFCMICPILSYLKIQRQTRRIPTIFDNPMFSIFSSVVLMIKYNFSCTVWVTRSVNNFIFF